MNAAELRLDLCQRIMARHKHPLVFATVSGAHLYGFPSPDSDYDLRGTHIVPAREMLALNPGDDTLESAGVEDGVEIDLVTHDVLKFFKLMLRKNGYVLEQLLSPLVVQTSPEHQELVSLAPGCITRFHAHHYLGFAETQWKLFSKENPPRVKPLLYVYRVLLTGIHLMRTGEVQANIVQLNESFKLPYIADLVARKTGGPEKGTLTAADMTFHEGEYTRLVRQLEDEQGNSKLPETSSAGPALDDLLVRIRLKSL
ncbi:MAG: nucleotidyltransferase domain-containing protein [Phycisphaerales bacterium]